MIRVLSSNRAVPVEEVVFFPFDHFNVPFLGGLRADLVTGKKKGIVVGRGEQGAVDYFQLNYYGSTVEIDGKYHMWYLGGGGTEDHRQFTAPCWYFDGICYAVSDDGVNREKPSLGLVEYNGNTDNNLVRLDCKSVAACLVLHDREDPDPERRFKMVFESSRYRKKMAVAYSPDGLNWRESPNNPVLPYVLEMAGLTRIGATYFVNGQNGTGDVGARALATHISGDFEHWTTAYNVGLRRDNIPGRLPAILPTDTHLVSGTQVHLGASLWNRGNTILGFYGIWNCPDGDRRHVYMDLGLAITVDGLNYHEPIPDFPIVRAADEDGGHPSLIQGQGWANIDDRTLYWFGGWRDGGVRLAEWERDRFGFVSTVDESLVPDSHLSTSSFIVEEGRARVFLNIDGLSEYNAVTVSVTNDRMRPIDGFGASDCSPVENGLRCPIRWKGSDAIPEGKNLLRLRIDISGVRARDVKLYCIYVENVG